VFHITEAGAFLAKPTEVILEVMFVLSVLSEAIIVQEKMNHVTYAVRDGGVDLRIG
jgi:hypothetical protein